MKKNNIFVGLFVSLLFCIISVHGTSAHLFHISSVTTEMSIDGKKIVADTTVALPYSLDGVESETKKKELLESTKEYIQDVFHIAYKNEKCQFGNMEVFPDPEKDLLTHLKGEFLCTKDIVSTEYLVFKSQLFQDLSSVDWTHFLFLDIGKQTEKEIILNFSENIYPNTDFVQQLTKDWGPAYGLFNDVSDDIEEIEPVNLGKIGEQKTITNNKLKNVFKIFTQFIIIGIEHIVFGFDHILFVVALVLLISGVKDILKLTITFTVAHSITLILASLGVVSLTGKIVEPIIALSIVYMAVQNILILRGKKEKKFDLKRRLYITFFFGLFHGLGFAGALSEINIPDQFFLTSLVSFNLGVEIGQLAIVFIILLPLLYFLKKYPWKSIVLQVISLLIAIISLYWFIERVFF